MVGAFREPSCGRRTQPIHSIPYSVAQPLERGSNNYYSIIQGGLTMYENDGGLLSPRDAYRLMLKDYPDVMDIGQMCEALGVSTKTGYKLLKDGKIEYLKIGRAYRIPKAHILRYLKITCSTFAE